MNFLDIRWALINVKVLEMSIQYKYYSYRSNQHTGNMDLQRLQQLLSNMPGRGAPAPDAPAPDTSEKIQISSLSLLKMLKHGTNTTVIYH